MNKMNKNKNIKSSQKEENVNVRREQQEREKPSVVSRSVRMRNMSYAEFFNSFSTNMMNIIKQVSASVQTGGIYNLTKTVDLSSYPEYFSVTSYNDHVYSIKIIKEFVYEHPIKLTYKEIIAFRSSFPNDDTTKFSKNNYNLSSFKKSKDKYNSDISQNKPWSVWFGKSLISPEDLELSWDNTDDTLFKKKVSSADGSLFTWQGKIVVKIDIKWNITLSFRTEDGWLPDNTQWIYGTLRMFRRELNLANKYVDRITSYAPPDVDGFQDEAVYTDKYNDTLRVIRRKPRVYCWRSNDVCIKPQEINYQNYNKWYENGLPYYYGPFKDCVSNNGTGTDQNCLQGMGRYVYISTKNDYNISDGTIYVSKSGAGKSIVDFDAHIAGYYDGQQKNDQDIKVKLSFNYLPKETGLVPNIVVCDPSTTVTNNTPTDYKIYYPPRELPFGVERALRFDSFFDYVEFKTDLKKLIVNDTSISDAFQNRNDLMSIITNSTGPISFELTNVVTYNSFYPPTVTLVEGYLFSIKARTNGFGSGNLGGGTFTLKITQGATSTYAKKDIDINFEWSIVSDISSFSYLIYFTRK